MTGYAISLSCDVNQHCGCPGEVMDEAMDEDDSAPLPRWCSCYCHEPAVQIWPTRGGGQVALMPDGSAVKI